MTVLDGDVTINGSLTVNGPVTINLPTGHRLTVITEDAVGGPFGRLIFEGNGLWVQADNDDPAELRLAGPRGGKISINKVRSDGVHEECGFWDLRYNPTTGATHIVLQARPANAGANDTYPLFVVSTDTTDDRIPNVWVWPSLDRHEKTDPLPEETPFLDAGPPPPPPLPEPDAVIGYPQAVLSAVNLTPWPAGTDPVSAISSDTDGPALTAIDENADVELQCTVDLTAMSYLNIKTHRRSSAGTPPLIEADVSDDGGANWIPVIRDTAHPFWHESSAPLPLMTGVVQVRIRGLVQDVDGKSINIGRMRAA